MDSVPEGSTGISRVAGREEEEKADEEQEQETSRKGEGKDRANCGLAVPN